MNRAERRKMGLKRKPQILDITAEEAARQGFAHDDLVLLKGIRRSADGGTEKCSIGQETPFRVNVVG